MDEEKNATENILHLSPPVLRDISFRLPSGHLTVIVGMMSKFRHKRREININFTRHTHKQCLLNIHIHSDSWFIVGSGSGKTSLLSAL